MFVLHGKFNQLATKLSICQGLYNEIGHKDATDAIGKRAAVIKEKAFIWCNHLVSAMLSENVKRIGMDFFEPSFSFHFICLSKRQEYSGKDAF